MIARRTCRISTCPLAAVAVLGWLAATVQAENWPNWRGPTNNGISTEVNLPTKWSRTENVVWRLALPGPAGATPVVWDNQIFLTAVDGNDLLLVSANTSGEELWRRTVTSGNKNVRRDEGNSCSPSPVIDGSRVWSFMGNGELGCYDFDGNPVWKLNLQDRFGRFNIQFGMTSTPVLYGDRLFFQLIHGDGDPSTREALVVALDKHTGESAWKHDRVSDARKECEHSYASPMIYDDGVMQFLVTHGADYVTAHSLDDGSEIWRCGGLNPQARYNPTLRFVASPATAPGLIVVPTAKNGAVIGLRPDVKGDVSNSGRARYWKRRSGTPDVPSPLIHDGLVYLCRENGNLVCLEAETGRELYENRTQIDRHRASPVYADGKIYLTSRSGVVSVVRAGREFEMLAQNELGEEISASPVISNGTLYLRSFDALWAIREPN